MPAAFIPYLNLAEEKKMKKKLKVTALILIVLFRFTGTASAQDINALVKKAVAELVAGRNTKIIVSIKTPAFGSTDSVSALSAYLYILIDRNAANNSLYEVVPPRQVTEPIRGAPPIRKGGEQRGQITGRYDILGDHVDVTLLLVSDPEEKRLAATSFNISNAELKRLNLDALPENRKNGAEVQAQADLFKNIPLSPPSLNTPANVPHTGAAVSAQSELMVQAWPNKESRIYFDGDVMTISLYASQDCWFKVYHIDVNNQMQLIYPNQTDKNNMLKANTKRVIPENTIFELGAPYGEETILAVFSRTPFENLEKDMVYPEPATPESINRAADRRGLTVQNKAANTPESPEKTMAVRFSYTILPADFIEETFSFKRPSDAVETVQSSRNEISLRHETFTGNEREGTYRLDDVRGSCRVSANELIPVIRRPHQPVNPQAVFGLLLAIDHSYRGGENNDERNDDNTRNSWAGGKTCFPLLSAACRQFSGLGSTEHFCSAEIRPGYRKRRVYRHNPA
jgi:hypothetical protein